MPSNHELRRDYVLDRAIASGKFGPQRRAFWSTQYDRDPARTEQTLAALVSATGDDPPYPEELFPELARPRSRRARPAAPPPPPPSPEVLDAEVTAWTKQLFPETVAAGASSRRVTRCND